VSTKGASGSKSGVTSDIICHLIQGIKIIF
jgi:hypothetical protein